VSGTVAAPEGITNPPIDELLAATDSKYSLVIYAAKRARQINAYYSQLGEGLLEYVGPLVDTHVQEKPLSIALREINDDLLKVADSKYALVIYGAQRARQINAYYSQLGEGLLEYVGPLVETHVHEKPLSIALREINEGLLTSEPTEA
jgi:DNA-directed RNA polymerase subunit omega